MSQQRRSIFITGAASGMGAATARRFAAEGWFVGCFDVDEAGLASLRDELGGEAGLFARLDVTDRSDFETAIAAFGAAAGDRMDILHNNAGIIANAPFDEMAWETIERIVSVNLFGTMIGIRAALPLLRRTQASLCVSTCSASAIFGSAGRAAYSASKHAVRGLSEALSIELRGQGVRVGCVIPGIIDTAMLTPAARAQMPTEGMWRVLPASDVADAVWSAYHGETEMLHFYVPPELVEYEHLASSQPELARDQARTRLEQG